MNPLVVNEIDFLCFSERGKGQETKCRIVSWEESTLSIFATALIRQNQTICFATVFIIHWNAVVSLVKFPKERS